MMTPTAPSPMRGMASAAVSATRPAAKAAMPTPATASPMTARRSEEPVVSWATSRRAAMGRTLLARSAGAMAETTVTVTPTTAAVTTVAVEMTTEPEGISRPTAPSSSRSP